MTIGILILLLDDKQRKCNFPGFKRTQRKWSFSVLKQMGASHGVCFFSLEELTPMHWRRRLRPRLSPQQLQKLFWNFFYSFLNFSMISYGNSSEWISIAMTATTMFFHTSDANELASSTSLSLSSKCLFTSFDK